MKQIVRTPAMWLCLAGLLAPLSGPSQESIPPQPEHYFNDYSGKVNRAKGHALEEMLARHATTCPIVVMIYPRMESEAELGGHTRQVAQSWGIDQKGKNNGVAIFVYLKEDQGYIQVGQGLKNRIPESTAKRIVEEQMRPRLNLRDYAGAVSATIDAVLKAAKPPRSYVSTEPDTSRYRGDGHRRPAPIPESAANVILLIAAIPFVFGAALWVWTGGWHKYNLKDPKDKERLLRNTDRLLLVHKILCWEITPSRKRSRKPSGRTHSSRPRGSKGGTEPLEGGGAGEDW